MSVTPRLSRKLQEILGAEAAEGLVSWMRDMEHEHSEGRDTIRADIAELRSANPMKWSLVF
jgi:hypothetical protein